MLDAARPRRVRLDQARRSGGKGPGKGPAAQNIFTTNYTETTNIHT